MPVDDRIFAKKLGFFLRYPIMIPALIFICLPSLPGWNKVENVPIEEAAWRAARDREMRSQESWLTIAGLFWLEEGDNEFGASSSSLVRLLPGSAPSIGGKFIKKGTKFTVEAASGVELFCGGKRVSRMEIRAGDSTSPDTLALGDFRMWVIRRGDRYAVRLRDLNAPALKKYAGLEYFLPSAGFRIEASFVPYSAPQSVKVEAKIVKRSEMLSPGTVKFSLQGREFEFVAFDDEERKTYFLVFGDETNGQETYDGGRFLDFQVDTGNRTVLNFNRSYNPPCAFTAFATCPFPPPQNRFPFRLEVGEKKYIHPAGHGGLS